MDLLEKIDKYINEEGVRGVRGKLGKKINMLDVEVFQSFQGKKRANWDLSFDDNKGISLDADDWKAEISVELYDEIPMEVEIEVTLTGTDKRGRSDSELLAKRTMKIKSEEDIDKIIKYLKNMAKKHFKVKI